MSWVSNAVIYQVYPRSFADSDGDGIGDVGGIRARLPYLRDLGVDAIWLSPWYVSPMADAGYDVADYRDIDPLFGTLAQAEDFLREAHEHGLRVIVDIVPNHCSSAHPLFVKALAGGVERELFHFRAGQGEHGQLPPNDWQSHFGGPAWTQAPDGLWYLHMFAPEQPDWNWDRAEVREDFLATLRFWLDRGVDGFRIDVADHLVKAAGLPDVGDTFGLPYANQEGVHEIFRSWRALGDQYPQQPVFVGELWQDEEELIKYLRPDELHTAFNFPFLMSPWDAGDLRSVIDATLSTHARVGAAPTWVLSNHDVAREVTRFGRDYTGHVWIPNGAPSDLALGTRRARAAALLSLALPGCAYVYQGEELGLPEVEDLPDEVLQDPRWLRSGHTDRGRDGCRVPLPWSGDAPPFGFSPAPATADPWLPQPESWAALTAAAQAADPKSMLSLYRSALRLRRGISAPGTGLTWIDAPEGVLAWRRGDFACVVNLSGVPVQLGNPPPVYEAPALADVPVEGKVLLASGPIDEGILPADTAVWLNVG